MIQMRLNPETNEIEVYAVWRDCEWFLLRSFAVQREAEKYWHYMHGGPDARQRFAWNDTPNGRKPLACDRLKEPWTFGEPPPDHGNHEPERGAG